MDQIRKLSYHYPDSIAMRALLQDWNMEFLHKTLIDQYITITVLKLMTKDDIELVMNMFPIGVKILFNYNLQKWQKHNPI